MYKQLTSEQRYTISVLLQNGMKQKDIAKAINVSPSPVSREIRRNSGIRGHYNWETPKQMQYAQNARSQVIVQLTRMSWKRRNAFLLPNSGLRNKYPVHWPMMASIFVMKPYTV